jgi:hypothetical protein
MALEITSQRLRRSSYYDSFLNLIYSPNKIIHESFILRMERPVFEVICKSLQFAFHSYGSDEKLLEFFKLITFSAVIISYSFEVKNDNFHCLLQIYKDNCKYELKNKLLSFINEFGGKYGNFVVIDRNLLENIRSQFY